MQIVADHRRDVVIFPMDEMVSESYPKRVTPRQWLALDEKAMVHLSMFVVIWADLGCQLTTLFIWSVLLRDPGGW